MGDAVSEVKVGQWNPLAVAKTTRDEVFVDGGADGLIILRPRLADLPERGTLLNVFVYPNHRNQLVATTQAPKGEVGQVVLLAVADKASAGFFLDWGLPKDLLLPFSETVGQPEVGEKVLVMIFRDAQGRLAASMRLSDFVTDEATEGLRSEQEVELVVADTTDLGVKAVVNHRCWGVIYHQDVSQPLKAGDKITGYVRRVRTDKRVDLSLHPVGLMKLDQDSERVLALLKEHNGHIALGDKSSPVLIKRITGMSKRAFKQACGRLYKQGLIVPGSNEITLQEKSPQ